MLKGKFKIFVFIILILLFVMFQLAYVMNFKKDVTQKEYGYKTNKKADYKVYLKNNDFIKEKYIEMNKVYISDLVDYIAVDFGYEHSSKNTRNDKKLYV